MKKSIVAFPSLANSLGSILCYRTFKRHMLDKLLLSLELIVLQVCISSENVLERFCCLSYFEMNNIT